MFACMSGACAEDYADMALAVTQLRAHLGLCAEKGGLTFRLIPLRMMDMVYALEKYGAEGSLVCLFYRGEAIEESKQQSVWGQLVVYLNAWVDMAHPAMQRRDTVFHNVNRIFRTLKALHPEWVVPVAALTFPLTDQCLGVTHLSPKGIGSPAIAK